MVRGHVFLADLFPQLVRKPLGQPPRVYEDQRGAMAFDLLGDAVEHVVPLFGGRDRLQILL